MKKILLSALISLFAFASCKEMNETNVPKPQQYNGGRTGSDDTKIAYFDPSTTAAERASVITAIENVLGGPSIDITEMCSCEPNIQIWQHPNIDQVNVTLDPQARTCFIRVGGVELTDTLQNKLKSLEDDIMLQNPTVIASPGGQSNINHSLKNLNKDEQKNDRKIIKIGYIDTGLNSDRLNRYGIPSSNLDMNLSYDFASQGVVTHDIDSQNEHGTQGVMIMLAQIGSLSYRNFTITPYQVFDEQGGARLFSVACAMIKAYNDGMNVVNMSVGHYGSPSTMLDLVIEHLGKINPNYGHNTMVIAAAGNGDAQTPSLNLDNDPFYPAAFSVISNKPRQNLISVTSFGRNIKNGNISVVFNYSPTLVDVGVTTIEGAYWNFIDHNKTPYVQGSSFSTPVVTGLVAWLLMDDTYLIPTINKSIFFDKMKTANIVTQQAPPSATVADKCIGCGEPVL